MTLVHEWRAWVLDTIPMAKAPSHIALRLVVHQAKTHHMNQTPPPVPHAFLSNPHKAHFIEGRWQHSLSGESIETVNPATGKLLATLARGRTEDVDLAVAAARRAFEGPWSGFTPHQRYALMLRVCDVLDRHFDPDRSPTTLRSLGAGTVTTKSGVFTTREVEMRVRDARNYKGEGVIRFSLSDDACRRPLRIESNIPGAGRVVLKGSAPDLAARERARSLAAAVDGVQAVENQLVINAKS